MHALPELTAAALRERMKLAPAAFSVYSGDDRADREAAAVTAAAVLVPIVMHATEFTVLLTQRTQHLKSHAGQISFPGGRAEPGDAAPEFTALREAQEEIGLVPDRAEIIGKLPDYFTRTGYRVTPVIALVTPPLELAPDPREVEEVFEVPLAFLLDPGNHRRETREIQGRTASYYVMQYESRRIWGATAGMLLSFYRHLVEEPAR